MFKFTGMSSRKERLYVKGKDIISYFLTPIKNNRWCSQFSTQTIFLCFVIFMQCFNMFPPDWFVLRLLSQKSRCGETFKYLKLNFCTSLTAMRTLWAKVALKRFLLLSIFLLGNCYLLIITTHAFQHPSYWNTKAICFSSEGNKVKSATVRFVISMKY